MEQLYGSANVVYRRVDVSSSNSIRELFDFCADTYGSIDVVVNNAGINGENNWETMLDINLKVSLTYYVLSFLQGRQVSNIHSIQGQCNNITGPDLNPLPVGLCRSSCVTRPILIISQRASLLGPTPPSVTWARTARAA